jgi:hypothetical protein
MHSDGRSQAVANRPKAGFRWQSHLTVKVRYGVSCGFQCIN